MDEKLKNTLKVTVFLGSKMPKDPAFRQAVTDLGNHLVQNDMTLVFGGSRAGTMKLLADTVIAGGGRTVGVFTKALPHRVIRRDLTETVMTRDLAERKAVMLGLADAVVVMPGGFGTWDELFDALALKRIRKLSCPVGLLNVDGFYDPLLAMMRNSLDRGFSSPKHLELLQVGRTVAELFDRLSPPEENKRNGRHRKPLEKQTERE